ncbi:MAG: hypothetical protein CVU47_02835 [Chloroflexi bacterium HGW-Chloroflexi-9]|nr:MAG: hypothetical protein CVU47_02835 [Chloroflexi bacterium HGW-Chloroflexi-9]
MFTSAVTHAASHRILTLAAAGGFALSAVFAGNAVLDGGSRTPSSPILVEADLGSLLHFGGATSTDGETSQPAAHLTEDAGGVPVGARQ